MATVLTLNGGSSSIRFALYETDDLLMPQLQRTLQGKIDRIGLSGTSLSFRETDAAEFISKGVDATSPAEFLIDWLSDRGAFNHVSAVGHRIVHGMRHTEPEVVTDALLSHLHIMHECDPEHLPKALELIEAIHQRFALIPQIVCFDTAFHHTMPRVAQLLPIPRRYEAMGVRRYGFHGLSYACLLKELKHLNDATATKGRVILAHLGNGASMAAISDGKSIDTSMSFTPASGLVAGTRSGDIDPGIMGYLNRTEGMTAAQFQHMVNHESGLLGVSETSSDIQDLLALESHDLRAAEAISVFCYQAKKCIGSLAAALGGLDTLVFAGGIGENCASIRSRICDDLAFLGIEIDEERNVKHEGVISKTSRSVRVRVIHTDEELIIAQSVSRLINPIAA